MTMRRILVINSGSSSLKYALFNIVNNIVKTSCANGIVERIGERSQNIKHSYLNENNSNETIKEEINHLISHKEALQHVLNLLSRSSNSSLSNDSIEAVGHRVVHGGEYLTKAQLINKDVMNAIEQASVLAPLHNPSNLSGIKTAMQIFSPRVQHVAVFDTAFHSTLPQHAYLYGLPYHYYTEHGIRKYGFHGTSHEYIMKETSKYLNKPIKNLNLITCHLGAGCSMCCIQNGVCVDTSMGMTPMAGLLMQTRCGDLDPGVIIYLMKHLNMSTNEVEKLLLKESGWYGMSGCQNARDLETSFLTNEKNAESTVMNIVHRIKSYLGAYYWLLQGDVDAVVFTGGVGENWPSLRELCFVDTRGLGFIIDKVTNSNTYLVTSAVDVSSSQSEKRILVIPTNEEYSIAEKTLHVINSKQNGSN